MYLLDEVRNYNPQLQVTLETIFLCPMENMVVWFCSLRKKPDVHIKAAIDRFY